MTTCNMNGCGWQTEHTDVQGIASALTLHFIAEHPEIWPMVQAEVDAICEAFELMEGM